MEVIFGKNSRHSRYNTSWCRIKRVVHNASLQFWFCCVVITLLFAVSIPIIATATFAGEVAEIEAVRTAVETASENGLGDTNNVENILGQAVEMNRKIAVLQEYNSIWWSGWAVPDTWADVQPVDISGK